MITMSHSFDEKPVASPPAAAPVTNKDTDSDVSETAPTVTSVEDDEDDELLQFTPFSQESNANASLPEQKYDSAAADPQIPAATEKEDPEKRKLLIELMAARQAEVAIIPNSITSTSQLYWRRRTNSKRTSKQEPHMLFEPCRICNPDEGLWLQSVGKFDSTLKALVQFIDYPGMSLKELVPWKMLIPYHGGPSSTQENPLAGNLEQQCDNTEKPWCKEKCEQLTHRRLHRKKVASNEELNSTLSSQSTDKEMQIQCDARAEIMFLENILEHTRKCERAALSLAAKEHAEHLATRQLHIEEEARQLLKTNREITDSTHTGIQATDCLNGLDESSSSGDDISILRRFKSEHIRAGDVIEYYHTMFCHGDESGRRTATVCSVDPKRNPVLVLDNGDCVPKYYLAKRLKIMVRGKLQDNKDNANFQPIEEYKLHKSTNVASANVATGAMKEADRVGKILTKHTEDLKRNSLANGQIPMDMFNEYKGARRRAVSVGSYLPQDIAKSGKSAKLSRNNDSKSNELYNNRRKRKSDILDKPVFSDFDRKKASLPQDAAMASTPAKKDRCVGSQPGRSRSTSARTDYQGAKRSAVSIGSYLSQDIAKSGKSAKFSRNDDSKSKELYNSRRKRKPDILDKPVFLDSDRKEASLLQSAVMASTPAKKDRCVGSQPGRSRSSSTGTAYQGAKRRAVSVGSYLSQDIAKSGKSAKLSRNNDSKAKELYNSRRKRKSDIQDKPVFSDSDRKKASLLQNAAMASTPAKKDRCVGSQPGRTRSTSARTTYSLNRLRQKPNNSVTTLG